MNRTPNEAEETDAARVKFAMIFARGKDIWRIYIYDINGATETFDIKKYFARRLRKFARRRRKISKIYAINHRKTELDKELGARKFRLFNPNGKKKYILKKSSPSSSPQTDYKARKSKPWRDI